jgi:uncharacterized membrane protein
MIREASRTLLCFILYILLCIGIALLAQLVAQYHTLELTVGFLASKQDYIHRPLWRMAFYVHVFSAIPTLLAGTVLFSSEIRQSIPVLHRWVGKLYVFDVLCINVPAGGILAVYANGGLSGKAAFVTLDVLWAWFTFRAYSEIRARRAAAHRRFMIRSYALTCSAITLRLWSNALPMIFTLDYGTLYIMSAWLGFLPNLVIAEIFNHRIRHSP